MAGSDGSQQRRSAPAAVAISPAQLTAIAAAHGVPNAPIEPVASIGIINSVYLWGDLVLRVPRDHPGHVAQAHREALAIPVVVAAGVRTPRLIAFDDTQEILPVPFLVVDRVEGVNAESVGVVPPEPRAAWRRLGADVARVHLCTTPAPPGQPWPDEVRDPHELVDLRAADGWISTLEARTFHDWLDRLAPLATAVPPVFVHGDLQMSNVILDPSTGGYVAVIDWGNARLGNAADDFSVVPLDAVAPMLEGYHELVPAGAIVTEASILWRRIQLVLSLLPRGAAPGWAWAERPVSRMADMLLHQPWPGLGPQPPAAAPRACAVRQATEGDAPRMQAGFHAGMGWAKPGGYFAARVAEARAGDLVVLVAEGDGGRYLGHALVRWEPGYAGFRHQRIPEIQDLNVVADHRRRGVASQLLDAAERLIARRSDRAGIGVGLYAAYGAAQRLYVARGYVPDGAGAVHGDQPLAPGRLVPVDDGLILYFVKRLTGATAAGPAGRSTGMTEERRTDEEQQDGEVAPEVPTSFATTGVGWPGREDDDPDVVELEDS